MLRDSLHSPDSGYHVEQVELVCSQGLATGRIYAAWEGTVAATEALRTVFDFTRGLPTGLHTVSDFPAMECLAGRPESWEAWCESERLKPLLFPGAVPWRVTFFPDSRTLVWTFHHALLDGRSITRVLREFLTRLWGGQGNNLRRSEWQPPSAASLAQARELFHQWPDVPAINAESLRSDGPMHRSLGADIAARLDARALELETTAATLVIWAWGQALTAVNGTDRVLVEQVRAGAPQPGTAGFAMNVLPLVIHRDDTNRLDDTLQTLRTDLIALRDIESVSFSDFAPGVYPDLELPGTSTIMVEHATLQQQLGACDLVESVVLNERKADVLTATAYLLPDLRLEVDGPGSRKLLDAWADLLCGL